MMTDGTDPPQRNTRQKYDDGMSSYDRERQVVGWGGTFVCGRACCVGGHVLFIRLFHRMIDYYYVPEVSC